MTAQECEGLKAPVKNATASQGDGCGSRLALLCPLRLRGLPGRGYEAKGKALLLGAADEVPMGGEQAAVADATVFEHDLAGLAEAGRRLGKFDEVLGGQAAGKRSCTRLFLVQAQFLPRRFPGNSLLLTPFA